MMNDVNLNLDFYNNYLLNDRNLWHEDKYILYKHLYEMKNKLITTYQQQKIINFYDYYNNNMNSKVFDVISNEKLCLGLYMNHGNNDITYLHDVNQSMNYEIINNNNFIFTFGKFHRINHSLYITLYDSSGCLWIFLCYPLVSSSSTTYTIHLITKVQLPQHNINSNDYHQVKHIIMIPTNDHDEIIHDNYPHSIELWIVYDRYIYYYDGYLHYDQLSSAPLSSSSLSSSSFSSDITLQLSFQLSYDQVKCEHFEVQ